VLNSYPLIKEAFSRKEFSGRPNMFSGTFFQKGKTGEPRVLFWRAWVRISLLIREQTSQICLDQSIFADMKKGHAGHRLLNHVHGQR
jgi:hypothetical protein